MIVYKSRGSDSAIFSSPSEADVSSTDSGLQSSTGDPPPITAAYVDVALPRHDYVNGTPSATLPGQFMRLS